MNLSRIFQEPPRDNEDHEEQEKHDGKEDNEEPTKTQTKTQTKPKTSELNKGQGLSANAQNFKAAAPDLRAEAQDFALERKARDVKSET